MTLEAFKKTFQAGELICPRCQKPVKKYEKYVDKMASVWDGAGDTPIETAGSAVTLICANETCAWKERTEYWDHYQKD